MTHTFHQWGAMRTLQQGTMYLLQNGFVLVIPLSNISPTSEEVGVFLQL